jgi:hypothetical protein
VLEKLKFEAEARSSKPEIRRIDFDDRRPPKVGSDQPLCFGDIASIYDFVGLAVHARPLASRITQTVLAVTAMANITRSDPYRRPIMGKLVGKVAIVTGAARGLGRAYAKRLAGLGAKVAVADLNLHSYEEFEAEAKDMAADSTVAEIEAGGGTALGIELDVRDHEAVEAMVARVVQDWGRIDVLVANAQAAVAVDQSTRRPAPLIRRSCSLSRK